MDEDFLENIKRLKRWQILSMLIKDDGGENGVVQLLKTFNVKAFHD